ncbi:MAG: DNA-binding protein [Candidatus Nanohaloarchaea archaeon]
MTDDELEELKKERMEELQEEGDSQEEAVEQQKQQIWSQAKNYMSKDAKERLSNIKAVNEDKALAVAQQIVSLGRSGQIQNITDQRMKQILSEISRSEQDSSNIKFRR